MDCFSNTETDQDFEPEQDQDCEHEWIKVGWNERSGSFVRQCNKCGEIDD